jgi:REP element-mobilizing transposase RayT
MSRKIRKRHLQLTLEHARRPDGKHGGWRPNAGRPKNQGAVSHATRPTEPARFPQHVTLRICEGVPSLARDASLKIIRAAIRASHKPSFRIVEFNVLGNHLHLITEASTKHALATGMQGFEVRVARRLNSALMRTGKLFAHRYHARYLKTPRETRNALRYVLLNRKHHNVEQRFSKYWIDPQSSAARRLGGAHPRRRAMEAAAAAARGADREANGLAADRWLEAARSVEVRRPAGLTAPALCWRRCERLHARADS